MEKIIGFIGIFIIAVALGLGLALLLTYPTLWIVNYLFTAQLLTFVFGAAKITFWQAFWLDAFFSIAFKSGSYSKSKD